jgi:signal transduction histidine kinase
MPLSSRAFLHTNLIFLLVGLLALVGIVGTSLWLSQRTQDYVTGVVQIREMRSALVDLRSLVQDLETGQRGYLLVREEPYLRPFENSIAAIPQKMARVRELLVNFPEMAGAVETLMQALDQKVTELTQTVELAKNDQLDQAMEIVRTDAGKVLMDQARELFSGLIERSDNLLNERIAEQRASASALRTVQLVGSIVILAMVGAVAWTVTRYTVELSTARREIQDLNVGLEQRVNERTEDLRRANEEIQRFAYIVTHDLRAPLVNIMGFTSELETSLTPISSLVADIESKEPDNQLLPDAKLSANEDLPEAISFIKSSTRKMDGLINAILKLSRDGRRALKPERVALEPLFEAATSAIGHQISEAEGDVFIDVKVPSVISDKMALEQIFGNILDNAVKYSQPGRPLKLAVRARSAPAGRAIIEIEDNGRGIAPQDHERVFELFRRSGTQDREGEGLGLAHVRSAIRTLGGDVTLRSELGVGTTFRIELPANLETILKGAA